MKILGIDYGRSKVGVSVGDSITRLVEPLKTIPNVQFTMYNVQKILNEQMIKKIVIGLPGGSMDNEIKVFGEKIAKETELPVEYFDETLTTQDAQRILIESGRSRKRRKEKEDAVAAALMLQYYLEDKRYV